MEKSSDQEQYSERGDRRHFLKQGLAALGGAAAASMIPSYESAAQEEAPALKPPGAMPDEAYWEEVRTHFHLKPDVRYMNNGSLGLCPKPVTKAVADGYVRLAQTGNLAWDAFWDDLWQTRQQTAAFLNADPEEIVFTRNATLGLEHIARGIRMEPDDVVLMTTDEHHAGRSPWEERASKYGIQVDKIFIPSPPKSVDEVVDLFEQAITPRTKVLFFCHITRGPGLLYPVKELCALARERGIISAVDGAQSPGMMPVDLQDLGCDLFATSLHKWALTPAGTGCLYVRQGFQETFWPASNGNGPWDGEHGLWRIAPQGTHAFPVYAAISPALDFLQTIGVENIAARDRFLSDYLKEQLSKLSHIKLATSLDHSLSSPGITSFEVEGWDSGLVQGILKGKFGIVASTDQNKYHDMVRVSTHFYNTPEEVDMLVSGLKLMV